MQFAVTFRHMEPTDALKTYARELLAGDAGVGIRPPSREIRRRARFERLAAVLRERPARIAG